MNYQKIVLVGNATKDAKRNKSKSGEVLYTTFSVGVSNGREKSTYIPVVVFGKSADIIADKVKKGCMVLVEGRLNINKQGRMNVIAENFRLHYPPKDIVPTKK